MKYLPPFLVSYVLIFLFGATWAAARHSTMHTHHNYQQRPSFIHLAGARKGDDVGASAGIRHVKTYLHRFGYLNLAGGNNYKEEEVDDEFDETLEHALLTYQGFFKLNKTGVLDHETITMMSEPRCGNPDDIPHGNGNYNFNKVQFKRHYQINHWNVRRNKAYLYIEFDPSVPITLKDSINQAFADWEPYVPLMFLRSFEYPDIDSTSSTSGSSVVVDIRAGFYKGYHSCVASFDGPGGVLAHANVGSGSVFHFDAEENWQNGAVPGGTDIRSVARHEIGHLLGLEHSSDANSLMYPLIGRGIVKEIADDDKAGIKALYYG